MTADERMPDVSTTPHDAASGGRTAGEGERRHACSTPRGDALDDTQVYEGLIWMTGYRSGGRPARSQRR